MDEHPAFPLGSLGSDHIHPLRPFQIIRPVQPEMP